LNRQLDKPRESVGEDVEGAEAEFAAVSLERRALVAERESQCRRGRNEGWIRGGSNWKMLLSVPRGRGLIERLDGKRNAMRKRHFLIFLIFFLGEVTNEELLKKMFFH
jgi:hypothetical protein